MLDLDLKTFMGKTVAPTTPNCRILKRQAFNSQLIVNLGILWSLFIFTSCNHPIFATAEEASHQFFSLYHINSLDHNRNGTQKLF